uniref:ATP synthase complex subunit 8 n=1 Tax=Novoplectron serratum TaxID=3073467 RepID=A0AAU7B9N1_9ORTH
MPQMAPLSWLFMFIMFSLTLLMFCSSNYFLFSILPSQAEKSSIKFNSFNWKW